MSPVLRSQSPFSVGLGRARFAADLSDEDVENFHIDTPDSPNVPRSVFGRANPDDNNRPTRGLSVFSSRKPPLSRTSAPNGVSFGSVARDRARSPSKNGSQPGTPVERSSAPFPPRDVPRERERDAMRDPPRGPHNGIGRDLDYDRGRAHAPPANLFDPAVPASNDSKSAPPRRRVFVRAEPPDLFPDEPLTQIAKGTSAAVHPGSASSVVGVHPFEHKAFERVLAMAGCLEMLDVSRKKVKGRFMHALGKHDFERHLLEFIELMGLKTLGTHMVRFVGDAPPVHSPFVHLYVSRVPDSTETIKVWVDSNTTASEAKGQLKVTKSTTWTHLETTLEGASHWSCKARGFWPLRVVFEGPKNAPEPEGEYFEPKKKILGLSPDPQLVPLARMPEPSAPDDEHHPAEGESQQQPTVVGALKQLGEAVAVSKMGTQISGTMANLKQGFSSWAARPGASQAGSDREETAEDAIARRERKERHRARKEAQARAEREEHLREDPRWVEPEEEMNRRYKKERDKDSREVRAGTFAEDRFVRQEASDWQREKDDYRREQLRRGEMVAGEGRRRQRHAVI